MAVALPPSFRSTRPAIKGNRVRGGGWPFLGQAVGPSLARCVSKHVLASWLPPRPSSPWYGACCRLKARGAQGSGCGGGRPVRGGRAGAAAATLSSACHAHRARGRGCRPRPRPAEGWRASFSQGLLGGRGLVGRARLAGATCLWTKAVTLETIGKVRIIEPRLGSSGALRGWRSFHPAWGVVRQLRQLRQLSPPTTKCLLSFPALGLALPVQHNLLPRPIPAASW